MDKEQRLDDQVREFMTRSGWEKLSEEELATAVSNELDKLVKKGLVERLIGEDGEFYYKSNKNKGGLYD